MGLHEAQFEQRLDYDPTFRSTRSPADASPGRASTPIRDYLQSLYTRKVDDQTRSLRRCPIQLLFQLHPTHSSQARKKPLRSIVQVDEYGMVRKEPLPDAERGDETDLAELQAVHEENWNQLKRLTGYRILPADADEIDDHADDASVRGEASGPSESSDHTNSNGTPSTNNQSGSGSSGGNSGSARRCAFRAEI